MEQQFTVAEISQLTQIILNSVESEYCKNIMVKDEYVRRITSEIIGIKNILYHKNLNKAIRKRQLWPFTKHDKKNNLELRKLLTFS